MNRQQILSYKKLYPKGTRVMLDSMDDDPRPVPPGTTGTVIAVDDIGSGMSGVTTEMAGNARVVDRPDELTCTDQISLFRTDSDDAPFRLLDDAFG